MHVSKWGNSLAIRIPSSIVNALELKEGEEIELHLAGERSFEIEKKPSVSALLERLQAFKQRTYRRFLFDLKRALTGKVKFNFFAFFELKRIHNAGRNPDSQGVAPFRNMHVSKWGNSLAIRIPSSIVNALELKEGEEIELHLAGERSFEIEKKPSVSALLERLQAFKQRTYRRFLFDLKRALTGKVKFNFFAFFELKRIHNAGRNPDSQGVAPFRNMHVDSS